MDINAVTEVVLRPSEFPGSDWRAGELLRKLDIPANSLVEQHAYRRFAQPTSADRPSP